MRRMYSEQELTKIIKEVSEAYIQELIEDGEFDDEIADYVDAYLVEHPVDITALEGQTIAPAIVNATTSISAPAISGDSIIENMSGYSFTKEATLNWEKVYAGAVKNGNKLTFVLFGTYTYATGDGDNEIGYFTIPSAIGNKLTPYTLGVVTNILDQKVTPFQINSSASAAPVMSKVEAAKQGSTRININFRGNASAGFTNESTYVFRYEITFLLSDSL